ncbi:AraC family transcriptional regulator [Amycolatopsis pithecellobii]|nr:AraC family transcriptional regulator [Amycolatopsis pithecellobii]
MSSTEYNDVEPWVVPHEVATPAGVFLRSTDPHEATEAISRCYEPGRVEVVDRSKPLDMRLWVNELPGLKLNYLSYGTDVRVTVPAGVRYVLCVPLMGRVTVGSGGRSVEASARTGVVISPSDPLYFENWSHDCRVLTARLDVDVLESLLATMLDEPLTGPIRFEPSLDLNDPPVRSVLRTVSLLRSELSRPDGITADPMMGAGMARLVMTGLLLAQPHNYSAKLHEPRPAVAPGNLRRAIELIDGDPMSVFGVADVARAAAIGIRALEEGFRKYVGTSPMAYLRKVRMARAHEELCRSDSAVTTAAAVARRWGFHHYGRFGVAYRQRYGCSPSETLRRTARESAY